MTNFKNIKDSFKDKEILDHAFTHKSWVNENPNVRTSNERLEFLGDAILEFIVSDELFKRFPDQPEGYLTALRANLVNTVNLAKLAKKLDLGTYLLLSKGEDDGGGRTNQSLLANTVESLIGAMFIDQGLKKTSEFIHENLLTDIDQKIQEPLKDYKSRLQEAVQSEGKSSPKYTVVSEEGPDHNKEFEVKVEVDGKTYGKGTGKSKSTAQQDAARMGLVKMGLEE